MKISLVAPAPVGRPLAMSTFGPPARSTRAPAMPSITGRPSTGSNTPGSTTGATAVGPTQCAPPSVDLYINCRFAPLRAPTPKTYTLPTLSVRTTQPSGCWLMPLLVAGPTCFVTQVRPPSADRATVSGTGNACPWLLLRKLAQHVYT